MRSIDTEDPAKLPLGAPPRVLAGAEARVVKSLIRARLFAAGEEPPVRIGPFVVLRLQGTGASGVVYAAYDERLDRKIAVKLLRSDRPHDASQARLLREARALARLAHPNVVAVHEVGVFEGRVFVAMEFVDGHPLDAWLSLRRRSWREVRDVFVQAGRGLAAAHAAGLVHRDFKPANVLVGADGRVRVADFGLAQAGPGDDGRPAAELAGEDDSRRSTSQRCAGTPGYMAPEQLRGGVADARSDQFGFCVSLYEGLHGARPFGAGELKALVEAVAAGAVDEPPRARRVPKWLRRVVLRGLSPAPEARWPSMEALLVRLERPWWSPAARWIAALAVLVVVAVVAAMQGATDGVCAPQGDEFAGVWDAPRQQRIAAALRASGASYADDAWRGLHRAVDAYTGQWRATRRASCEATLVARSQSPTRMDLRAACLDRRRSELAALLELYAREPVAPASAVQRAAAAVTELPPVALCAAVRGPDDGVEPPPPARVTAVAALRGRLAAVHARELAGDYPTALAAAEAAVTAARALDYPPALAEALYQRGRVEAALDAGPRTAATLEEASAIAEAARHDRLKAQAWTLLIRVAALADDDPARAHSWFRLARAALERGDERGAAWADALEGEGLALHAESRFEAALAVQREVLALRERLLGPRHLKLATTYTHIANSLDARGDKAGALELYERAAALQAELLGPRHPELAVALFDLALVAIDLGELARAEQVLAQVRGIDLEAHGPRSRRLAQIGLAHALLREQQGEFAAALADAEAAVAQLAALAPDHREYATALGTRGTLLFRLGRADEALADYRRACEVWRRSADVEGAAMCASDEGEALLALGRAEAALGRFTASQAALAEIHPADHELLAYPLHGEGAALLALGRSAAAEAPLRRALQIRLAGPSDPLELAETMWALARTLAAAGSLDEAVALRQEAHARLVTLGPRGARARAELERWPKFTRRRGR